MAIIGDAPGTAVDVYSFGVCLWELCVRVYPWHELLEAGRVEELKRLVGRRAVRLESETCPLPFRLIIEACWRQEPVRRPDFATLSKLDLSGIGRGSTQAVRQMRELLWPDGPPEWAKELDTAEGSAGSSTVSLESMSGALSDTLLAHASSPAAVSESET